MTKQVGKITQIIGPVIDVSFDAENSTLPQILDALEITKENGQKVTTVEGLSQPDGSLHPLQQAFKNQNGLQCGFCTPGMLMTCTAYLEEKSAPTEREIREVISGNICRCTGYQGIVNATLEVANNKSTNGGA